MLFMNKKENFEYYIDKVRFSLRKIENLKIDVDAEYLKRGVFIVGSGKSGTTLMQALFDFHPNLLTLPVETRLYFNKNIIFNLKSKSKLVKYLLYNTNLKWFSYKIYNKHSLEKFRDFSKINYQMFKRIIHSLNGSKKDLPCIFRYVCEAYRKAVGYKIKNIFSFVEKTPIHMFYIDTIVKDFPNAKIIHILRDPLDNYYAYQKKQFKKKQNKKKETFLKTHFDKIIMKSFEIAINYQDNQNYKIVKYEDIIRNTKEEMYDLSNFIGVTFDESLLDVTICGNNWLGNSSSGKELKGISKERIGIGERYVSEIEKNYIRNQIGSLENQFGYFQ